MIEVPVYVPSRRGAGRDRRMGDHLARLLLPRSAIVGRPDEDDRDLIVVYYEGNKYGAQNIVTFADRAMHAYWRMRDRYPTIAMMAVPRGQLVQAATLYPEHYRIEVHNARQMIQLAHWLEVPIGNGLSERLESELKCEGAHPPAAVR